MLVGTSGGVAGWPRSRLVPAWTIHDSAEVPRLGRSITRKPYCYSTYFIHNSMISARLAHQQSAPSTPERREGQHLHWVLVPDPRSEGPGREPGGSGGSTRQAPQGRADHVARTPGRNPVAFWLCRFDSCLAHPHDNALPPAWRRVLPGSGLCPRVSEARSPQFDSGQGDKSRRTAACPRG
jgi:hypothetical protein